MHTSSMWTTCLLSSCQCMHDVASTTNNASDGDNSPSGSGSKEMFIDAMRSILRCSDLDPAEVNPMRSVVRRRILTPTSNSVPDASSSSPSSKTSSFSLRAAAFLCTGFTASVILIARIIQSNHRTKTIPFHLLPSNATSDDEKILSTSRIPIENYKHPHFRARGVACMPTVTRELDGVRIEYVSNAVKSWRLATNRSLDLRQLTVYDMDLLPAVHPLWLQNVFASAVTELPSWLKLAKREDQLLEARKLTLGDDEHRVRWRSKEAQDYAQVLHRCAEHTDVEYIIIVQDDVLFREHMSNVIPWCDKHLQDSFTLNEQGRPKQTRKCSASLFDLSDEKEDAHELRSSNMVARVWRKDFVNSMVRYISTNFDEAPVDWLADRRCRNQRRRNVVMEPNPVRHRGLVSSFSANKRDVTLT